MSQQPHAVYQDAFGETPSEEDLKAYRFRVGFELKKEYIVMAPDPETAHETVFSITSVPEDEVPMEDYEEEILHYDEIPKDEIDEDVGPIPSPEERANTIGANAIKNLFQEVGNNLRDMGVGPDETRKALDSIVERLPDDAAGEVQLAISNAVREQIEQIERNAVEDEHDYTPGM